MQETRQSLGGDELQTLKRLALSGGLEGDEKLSCASLADRLGVSSQTASRRLQRLDEGGYVDREIVTDGQWVQLTGDGERRLRAEYTDYQHVFEEERDVTLTGVVTSGMGEGRHYISLPGYMRQFREKLGYEPFAGTLNVDLTDRSVRTRQQLNAVDPTTIEGWEDDDRTYGPAYCYAASVSTDEDTCEQVHVITPERTHHGDDHLEIIAPERLRDTLVLEDGDEVSVNVEKR